MPHAIAGVLITCDVPTKEYLLNLNEKQATKFIIEDIDDSHLFVMEAHVAFIRKKLDELYDENQFSQIK